MKYIFIDSNQYRHIFSRSEGFSDIVYNLLIKLTEKKQLRLLLPQQTKEEVERNKYRKWPENEIKSLNNKIEKLRTLSEEVEKKFSEYSSFQKLCNEIKKSIKRLEKEQKLIRKTFVDNGSKQNQRLNELFNRANPIEEVEEVLKKAYTRYKKGNPPYDKRGMGDALIWESLLYFFKNSDTKKAHLIFVTNDKDAWGENEFDQWLTDEYEKVIGGKIFFSNKLSDIPEFTKEEQGKIRKAETESLKRNAVIDFANSLSFIAAGENAQRLLKFKKLLNSDDYREILGASLSNGQIYESFFTTPTLMELVAGEDGHVTKEIESIDGELWRQFSERYNIFLKRQSDQIESSENEIGIKNIPF